METFKASVQYNDLKGSTVVGNADIEMTNKQFKDNGDINNNESVIDISMLAGGNHGIHKDPVRVKFLVSKLDYNIQEKIKASNSNNFFAKQT